MHELPFYVGDYPPADHPSRPQSTGRVYVTDSTVHVITADLEAIEARLWRIYGRLLVFMREVNGVRRSRVAKYLGCTPAVLKAIEEGRGMRTARYRRIAERIELLAEEGFDLKQAERAAEAVRQVMREEPPTDDDYLAIYRQRAEGEV